jgi:hypothetical protein
MGLAGQAAQTMTHRTMAQHNMNQSKWSQRKINGQTNGKHIQ